MKTSNQSNIFVKTMLFVVLAIILTVGVTYAYFRANITGVESESTISVGGATLAIKYEGTNMITAENVIPGWSAKKYFNVDVTNTSGKDISYDINLIVENSNFVTPDTFNEEDPLAPSYLGFGLFECDSAEDKTCDNYLNEGIIAIQSGKQLIHSVTTNKSERTYYALEIVFPNEDFEQSQIGTDGNPLYFSGYVTIDSTKNVYTTQFDKDSWATIASNIQSGNASVYRVGDEKEVKMDIDDDGIAESYTVRVANNSNYDCNHSSETACGFVVEFVDIVEERVMISENSIVIANGWGATSLNAYLNEVFLSKLPSELQSLITHTHVESGHHSYVSNNYTSIDKIYLLSTAEVWTNGISSYDTATSSTRQLDYYESIGVTTSNYTKAIKKYNGNTSCWWLRTAYSNNDIDFLTVLPNGYVSHMNAKMSCGLVPVFRLFDGQDRIE